MPAAGNNNKFWNLAGTNEALSQMLKTLVFLEPHRAFCFLLSLGERIEVRTGRSCNKLLKARPRTSICPESFLAADFLIPHWHWRTCLSPWGEDVG